MQKQPKQTHAADNVAKEGDDRDDEGVVLMFLLALGSTLVLTAAVVVCAFWFV